MSYLDIVNEYKGDSNVTINESVDVDSYGKELSQDIKDEILKVFPKSFVKSKFTDNLGKSITVWFALGKDKSEFSNAIIDNDPCYTIVHIWFNKDNSMTIENSSMGFSVRTKPPEGSFYAFDKVKVGWRKSKVKEGDTKKVLSVFKKNFTKMKDALKKVLSDGTAIDPELIKSKI
jgi:hypothetical protein